VLARQAAATLRRGEAVPEPLVSAVEALAQAAAGLGPVLAGTTDPHDVLELLERAATAAATPLDPEQGLYLAPMLGQVRLSVADLVQALGVPAQQARAMVHRDAGAGQPG
jgi:hypothetical protein